MKEKKASDNTRYKEELQAAMEAARLKRLRAQQARADSRMRQRLYEFALEFDFCTRQEQADAYKAMTGAWKWGKDTRPDRL